MKSQSAQPAPAIGSKNALNGPPTPERNPVVGEPPWIQAASPNRVMTPVSRSVPVA